MMLKHPTLGSTTTAAPTQRDLHIRSINEFGRKHVAAIIVRKDG
jgi:hypothetical protein